MDRKAYIRKKVLEIGVEYTISASESADAIEVNCSAVDEETDRNTAKWIRDQLKSGNEWAWCDVKVTCELNGWHLKGVAHLACCSYKSEQDFKDSGYYSDMQDEALFDLIETIANQANKIESLGFEVRP